MYYFNNISNFEITLVCNVQTKRIIIFGHRDDRMPAITVLINTLDSKVIHLIVSSTLL